VRGWNLKERERRGYGRGRGREEGTSEEWDEGDGVEAKLSTNVITINVMTLFNIPLSSQRGAIRELLGC
jgi:hypothetical protein